MSSRGVSSFGEIGGEKDLGGCGLAVDDEDLPTMIEVPVDGWGLPGYAIDEHRRGDEPVRFWAFDGDGEHQVIPIGPIECLWSFGLIISDLVLIRAPFKR